MLHPQLFGCTYQLATMRKDASHLRKVHLGAEHKFVGLHKFTTETSGQCNLGHPSRPWTIRIMDHHKSSATAAAD